jgi:hypothetical protein
MRIPRIREIAFSPLLWKECIVKDSPFRTIKDVHSYFRDELAEVEWCKSINVNVTNRRIRRLINGYAVFDVLEWGGKIEGLRIKMWQLFEDLVGEILREALRTKDTCTVVHVDRHPGFKGLDYVVTNNRKKEGWTVGVQCKRYIRSGLSKCRLGQCRSWSRGTSAAQLFEKGKDLHNRFGSEKKFVLVAFNAFRRNIQQDQRFKKLKQSWNCMMVLDKSASDETPYTYKIDFEKELKRVVKWC